MLRRFPRVRTSESESTKSENSAEEMQNAVLIVSAAQSGRLRKMKMILDGLPKDEARKLTNKNVNGTTPLVVAARNGHADVVTYLVDHGADIEQTGQVTFDGETIEDAPPLWCASAAGHFDIVKYLVRKGANVNHTTKTNSTPLRAACFDGHYDIVHFLVIRGGDVEIANRHGHTCLMIACFKGHYKIAKYLLEQKANLNRKSTKGNTALHDCAESGSLEIMKLLFIYNASMQSDVYGMTPLTAASVTGHTTIVEYLVGRADCTSKDRVEALELLGATYVDKKRDLMSALHYWKRAMSERWHVGGDLLPNTDNPSPLQRYEMLQEVKSVEDMDDLITTPDQMRMYALIIREKVLGPAHPDTSYYIRYRGAVYADTGNFDRCIYLWNYALDMQMSMLEPMNPMTQSSLLSFAELFSYMLSDVTSSASSHHIRSRRQRITRPASLDEVLHIFNKTVRELRVGLKHGESNKGETGCGCGGATDLTANWSVSYDRLVTIAMHLLALLCRLRPSLKPDDDLRIIQSVKPLLPLVPARLESGKTTLHYAANRGTTWVGKYPVQNFPSPDVITLLLDCGARVNATNEQGETALMVASKNDDYNLDVMKVLLEGGAHIDQCDKIGRSIRNYLTGKQLVQLSPAKYSSLKCFAARAIVINSLPYKTLLPHGLHDFINQHTSQDHSTLTTTT